MTTFPLRPASRATPASRPGFFDRLAAHLAVPSIRELDAAMLKDIGATDEMRAQAELRDAYRHWFPTDDWHGL